MDFQFAGIAGANIDFADGEAASKPPPRRTIEICGQLGKRRIVGRKPCLGQRTRVRLSNKVLCMQCSLSLRLSLMGDAEPPSQPCTSRLLKNGHLR